MAFFTGHDGVVKITGESLSGADQQVGNLRSFTIDQTQDAVETTVMGSSGNYRTYQPGLSTFTVSGDMYFDFTDVATAKIDDFMSMSGDSTLGTIECYPSGTATTTGNTKLHGGFVFTSFSITSSVDGVVECSFSGQGTGALTTEQTS
jgi:predicted secreted protein